MSMVPKSDSVSSLQQLIKVFGCTKKLSQSQANLSDQWSKRDAWLQRGNAWQQNVTFQQLWQNLEAQKSHFYSGSKVLYSFFTYQTGQKPDYHSCQQFSDTQQTLPVSFSSYISLIFSYILNIISFSHDFLRLVDEKCFSMKCSNF